MSNIPWTKEQLFKANEKLRQQNKSLQESLNLMGYTTNEIIQHSEAKDKIITRYEKALEDIAYKQHNVEPKRVVVKLQSKAIQALQGGNENE